MYREVGQETHPGRWGDQLYRIFRCGHCKAWLVLTETGSPPKVCGKCHL